MTADVSARPKISVICPTFERHEWHERLYECFAHQDTDEERELLILDDSPTPSDFFLRLKDIDPRVTYAHTKERLSIGTKRNQLCEAARGSVIAHFDDDDYYAPSYLRSMCATLHKANATFAKISAWHACRLSDQSFWKWDTRYVEPSHFSVSGLNYQGSPVLENFEHCLVGGGLDFRVRTLWGYGFSYVYLREAWSHNEFTNQNHGEDYAFACGLWTKMFPMVHVPDSEGICLHTLHPKSTSSIFPQKRLTLVEASTALGSAALAHVRISG